MKQALRCVLPPPRNRAALGLLEEAWAGWLRALGGQGQLDAALEVEERARATFPDSLCITQAVESARRGASR